ncbi:MAG TPA: LCP family protein, partial [Symbiobacteriaceae bacterium]|nr:LCP family protein [Symbiobacteriaceae bacterium]
MSRAAGRKRWLSWLLAGLAALTLLGGLALYRPFESQASSMLDVDPASSAEPAPPPPKLPVKRTTFLLLGTDRRPDDSGRADTMIVVSYDSAQQTLGMVSLPRDIWVNIPGHGYDKLNHSYAYGGEKLAISAVEGLLGIPIDHYVTFTFQGFAGIVDAVGGIDIDAEKRMYYHDPSDTSMGPDGLIIDIEPGPQHMDGITALKYARFRMDDEGDMGRVRRQQQVAMVLAKTAASPAMLAKVPQLIPAIAETLDTDLTVAEMVKLAVGGKESIAKPLRTGTVGGVDGNIAGVYYLIPDLVASRTLAYEILVGSEPPED